MSTGAPVAKDCRSWTIDFNTACFQGTLNKARVPHLWLHHDAIMPV